MSTIFGAIAENDHERAFIITRGQELVWRVAQEWIARRNAEFALTVALFFEDTTEAFKQRYKRPGAGYMQRRGAQSQAGTIKATGSWDVSFPLEDFEIAIGWNDVDIAYMTPLELSNHVVTGMNGFVNTTRWEILHRLFDNVQGTFTDPIHGSLTPEPLANGDSVTYPPITGEPTSEATEDHYLESGYTAANISDTNNPIITMRDDLNHHTGGPTTGGENIIVFANSAQRAQIEGLTNFTEVTDRFTAVGDNVDTLTALPTAPGITWGRSDGCWLQGWDFVPANYLLAVSLDEPAPLMKRVDPADTGLGNGDLMLVATDEQHPFTTSFWRARFGVGAGNRLNGVAMELGTGGSYTIPTAYD
jgi:hypothetical protein